MSRPLELEDLVPGTHLGHYVITDKIAQGGMGTVFKALEPALERYVAIKVLRPEYAANPNYVQYFQDEARAVAALRHPNIIPIFYIGQEGNVVFFSMSYIEGETFENWIESRRWFNEEQAKWFLGHAVAALHSAHKANIVHLDIKPANFLVDRANNIMLTDFGLAQKIVKDAGEAGEREAFGTPAYVSPEQISRGQTDQRTDIYSLGATLFHLMTGKQPFGGTTLEDIIWGHLEKPFPIEIAREANIPTGWIHLIQKMMERSPDKRFADYRELRAALENVHAFRYETAELETPQELKSVSVPRTGHNTQTLHGLLAQTKQPWSTAETKMGSSLNLSRTQVEEALKNRLEPFQVHLLVNTIRDLCHPRAEEPAALAEVMDKVPGYESAVRLLVNFMINPEGADNSAETMSAVDALETLGLERARNLAITFFALNYENPKSPTFDWLPLWRHQISVGVVIDFLYDALDLKRTSLEYATGTFHDLGKMILAELYPFAYFTAMNRSMHDSLPLLICEREIFGIDHAEIGANWLKENDFPQPLIDAVALHEMPARINRRAILSHALVSTNHLVKQIGIGYSGNSLLDPRPWEELPSTQIIWDARGNRDYPFEDFTADILNQFQSFPDLL
ncbi:MAG TPA: protein kinase [Candidatus Methylacidiphilales bacterium]|jgi:serine/threonine protein kinase|nr:protein kinase [Candidatus Methylacidiphilales bacterium]